MKMKSLFLITILAVMLSGCLRGENSPEASSTTMIDWTQIKIEKTTTTLQENITTTTIANVSNVVTTITLCPAGEHFYQGVIKGLMYTGCLSDTPETTTSTTSTTTTSTTTTIKKRTLAAVMPARMKINANWTSCTKNRDCFIVADCCGWEYGFKYAINEWSATEFEMYRSDFCQAKDHRKGCGWSMPQYSQARCNSGRCETSYGGLTVDDLPDNNFTYFFDWIKGINDVNYTLESG